MTIKNRSRLIVFILSFLIWLALTHIGDVQEVIIGLIVAFVVSLLAGQFFLSSKSSGNFLRRFLKGIIYFFKFIWEMIKANLHVAYIVLHPKLPIKPGIVKIKTKLTKDSAITVLTNSITLTPGTLTVDVNPESKDLYVHWITVASKDVEINTKLIGGRFEKLLMEVFE